MPSAVIMNADAPVYAPAAIETISPEDFETASIRSAAPSYTSDAPSYHSTVPNPEPVPPYSSSERPTSTTTATTTAGTSSPAPLISSEPGSAPRQGLPPIPAAPISYSSLPSLGQFRIPSWSTTHANPTYHRVALRRVAAASRDNRLEGIRRALDRIEEEEQRNRAPCVRHLEDPYLVGEAAAAQARRERLARENGDEILIREDRRWDFFLSELSSRRSRGGRLAMR
ncbi:hypothetical protein QBC34DRAFT_206942 [Podospora aff. communis PSN243]|uniref:Uncharacterized protein n=1 Tax=Podospora aff. communis PSN243 TaxID=3040156 RepID=A0AAV9GZT7_9PEZI|nr:hypothetical protein QBC34DRAFT_206942 [Podospora aff. communis PSN243]